MVSSVLGIDTLIFIFHAATCVGPTGGKKQVAVTEQNLLTKMPCFCVSKQLQQQATEYATIPSVDSCR